MGLRIRDPNTLLKRTSCPSYFPEPEAPFPFQTNFAKQPDLNNLGIPSKTRPQDWFAGFAFYLHIQSAVFIGTVATYGRIVGSIHVEHQLTSGLGFQDLLFDSKEAGRIKCLPRHFLTRCDQQY